MSDPVREQVKHGHVFQSLELTNFLSYKSAKLEFDDIVAIVGQNASGKSNFVSAIKLLGEIGSHGLPIAIARRGGYEQLRHRSSGRPNNPAIKLKFLYDGQAERSSIYQISFSSVKGGTYKVKQEKGVIYVDDQVFEFLSDGETVQSSINGEKERSTKVAPGHSAITGGASFAAWLVSMALEKMQTVEVNPAVIREFQEPSSTRRFESDGSNVVSVYDAFNASQREELTSLLGAIVPGIVRVEVSSLAGQQTLRFGQQTPNGVREFNARQMSDGTLRAFSILTALLQPEKPRLIVIEEPEIAIHLGALHALVDILKTEAESMQIILTTHSADIVDALPIEDIRVVWTDGDQSKIAPVSNGTISVVHDNLLSTGELLRAHALDPEVTI